MDTPPKAEPAPAASQPAPPLVSAQPRTNRKSLRRCLADAAFILIFVFCVRFLDPFGIDEGLTNRVEDIVVNILSGWYPPTGQQQVLVVLIDDNYLDYRKAHAATAAPIWPLSLQDHEAILTQLYENGAKSILVDMIYAYERGGEGEAGNFAGLIRRITRGRTNEPGVPVLLADIFGTAMPARHCEDPGRDLPNGMVLPAVACAATAVVPVTFFVEHETYPAKSNPSCNKLWPTAAFAQFATGSDATPFDCGTKFQDRPSLFLRWGSAVSETMAVDPYGDQECRYEQGHLRFYHRIEITVDGFLGAGSYLLHRQRCRYTDTISAVDLFSNDAAVHKRVSDLVKGRYVLIGTDMAGDTDRFQSPVEDDVPGVYLHAMALDNLLVAQADSPGARTPRYYEVKGNDPFWVSEEVWITALIIGTWVATESLIEDLGERVHRRRRNSRLTQADKPPDHPPVRLIQLISWVIRIALLALFLVFSVRLDFLDLPVALGIAVTVLIVETFLKLAMGIRLLGKDPT